MAKWFGKVPGSPPPLTLLHSLRLPVRILKLLSLFELFVSLRP